MLHITNGHATSLAETGLQGDIVYWADVLHDGPVPAGLSLEQLSRVRERFLSGFFETPRDQVSFRERDDALAAFRDHEEVVLWFEHDLYDQLQLIQILDWFSEREMGTTRLSLICMDRYLGPMQPAELAGLFGLRHTVSAAELKLAQRAWSAFRNPEPTGIEALVRSDTSVLPFLRAAFIRHLEQFPSVRRGLSRTETQALDLVNSGLSQFQELFPADQKREEQIFLGDASYRNYLHGLAGCRRPLLNADNDRFEMTAVGRDVRDAREDHVRLNGINRWLGGVHLCEGAPVWRWDEAERTVRP